MHKLQSWLSCLSKEKFRLKPPRLGIFNEIISSECTKFRHLIQESFSGVCERGRLDCYLIPRRHHGMNSALFFENNYRIRCRNILYYEKIISLIILLSHLYSIEYIIVMWSIAIACLAHDTLRAFISEMKKVNFIL